METKGAQIPVERLAQSPQSTGLPQLKIEKRQALLVESQAAAQQMGVLPIWLVSPAEEPDPNVYQGIAMLEKHLQNLSEQLNKRRRGSFPTAPVQR